MDTGGQAIGQAFAGLGERLFQFGEKKQQAQNALDLSKQKRKFDELNLATYNALKDVTDDVEAEKILSQYQSDAGSLKTGNSAVDSQFEMHVNDTITGVTESFGKRLETNKVKKLNDEFEVNYSGLLSSGNFDGASELIGNMQSSGAITAVKADGLRKTFVADSFLQQAENKINQGGPDSLEDAGGMLDALSKQDKVKLTSDQLDKMDNLKTQMYAAQNRKNGELAVQQDKEQWDLYKKSEDGTLTQSMLDNSVISADEKRQIWNNYQVVQYQKAKTGVSALEEGDPTILAEVNKIVDLYPDKITPRQIYNIKGLGEKHKTGLVDRLNKNLEDKDPIAKKYKSQLASVYEAKMFGEKIKPETSATYMKLQGELDTFLAKNPTDEQAQKYFNNMISKDTVKTKWSAASIFSRGVAGLGYLPPVLIYKGLRSLASGSPETTPNTPPKEYPDATWDTTNNMWTVVRNGRKMGVQ